MVGGTAKIGAQEFFAPGRASGVIRLFQGDKDRIDLEQGLRVGDRQNPSPLRLVVVVENSQVPNLHFAAAIPLTPRVIRIFRRRSP